jgi:hypothetical protein
MPWCANGPTSFGEAALIAPILILAAGALIYFDYRLVGIAIAILVAILALPQWYWMFQRGREIDFDAPTPSGRPVRAGTYLFWGSIAVAVAVVGVVAD